MLVACSAFSLDGIRLESHATVYMSIPTYQLPIFPVDSAHPLRITGLVLTLLNPWPSGAIPGYQLPSAGIPLTERH